MKAKVLLNLLPLGAIALVGWLYVSSQWQQSQAKRPVMMTQPPLPQRQDFCRSLKVSQQL
jgi:hypothetical protein